LGETGAPGRALREVTRAPTRRSSHRCIALRVGAGFLARPADLHGSPAHSNGGTGGFRLVFWFLSQSAGETVGVRFAVLSLAREYRGRDETDERDGERA
jgi:hypothetical protein